jgi:hypothetical protein
MKIQPQKNDNLPKYAAVIAAAVSAGLIGGFAVPSTSAASSNAPTGNGAGEYHTTTVSEGTSPYEPEMTEMKGTAPYVPEMTELSGTSPYVPEMTELSGTSPYVPEETELFETTPYEPKPTLEGTAPAYSTTERITTELVPDGTFPAITTRAPETTPTLLPEGTSPATTTMEPETTPELRPEGTSPAITTTTTETTCPVQLGGVAPMPEPKHEVTDVVSLQKYLLGKSALDEEKQQLLDMDRDGEVDVYDLGLMKRELIEENANNG